ncbi:hypothetical protein [Streptomyces sulfonofaciens]|uniref:hypothetical protein n=1 Tax=Streptomyces sulfonofaciens TaxID=68272 RepID=UPI001E3191DB|nr:hypothetical protein [Streptomyces sulfonofaciens]
MPDEPTSSFVAVPYPDLPALPEGLRGRYVAGVRIVCTGRAGEGERLVAPLRRLGPVLADSLRERPYAESRTIRSGPDFRYGYHGDSAVLSGLGPAAAREPPALTGPAAPMMCAGQPPGGRARRRAPGAERGAAPGRPVPGAAAVRLGGTDRGACGPTTPRCSDCSPPGRRGAC